MSRVTLTMQVRLQTGRCASGTGTCLFSTVELPWNSLAVGWKLKLLQNVIPTDNFCQPGRVVLDSKSGAPQNDTEQRTRCSLLLSSARDLTRRSSTYWLS